MPSTLFIRPTQVYNLEESLFQWSLYDVTGEQIKVGPGMPLAMIEQTLMQNGYDNVDVVALWPASACFATSVSLPGNQSRYLQQALPFAVEEQVAQDIEQIHISLGAKSKSGEHTVINTDKSLFASLFELLTNEEESELTLRGIFTDADLISQEEDEAVVLLGENQVLIKGLGRHAVASTHSENLLPLIDSILLGADEEEGETDAITLKLIVPPSQSENYQMLCAQLDQYPNITTLVEQTSLTEFELLCDNYFTNKQKLISLCQGEFAVSSGGSDGWKKWRSVAAIAAVGLVLQIGLFIGQGHYYQTQAELAGQEAVASYKKIVPSASKVSLQKLPRIIKGKINQSRNAPVGENGFLELLGEAGFQFNKNKYKHQIKFKSISYNETRGELVMEMQANSFDQLESLKKAIVQAGFSAKISSAVQEKEFFRGRISVSGAGA